MKRVVTELLGLIGALLFMAGVVIVAHGYVLWNFGSMLRSLLGV